MTQSPAAFTSRSIVPANSGRYGAARAVKPFVQQIADPTAVLTLDDTVEAKPYMDQNSLIRYHYDHCQQAAIKGINQLTALYTTQHGSLPVAYKLIEKNQAATDPKTGKTKWSSAVSKQEYFRQLIRRCLANNLVSKYVLADSWFSSTENFTFIAGLGQPFVMPLKANRKLAFSQTDQQQGRYQSIESLVFEAHQAHVVWLANLYFPVLLTKQVFKDGDTVLGMLYLVTNDLTVRRSGLVLSAFRRNTPGVGKSKSFTSRSSRMRVIAVRQPTRFVRKATIYSWSCWPLSSWKLCGYLRPRIIFR